MKFLNIFKPFEDQEMLKLRKEVEEKLVRYREAIERVEADIKELEIYDAYFSRYDSLESVPIAVAARVFKKLHESTELRDRIQKESNEARSYFFENDPIYIRWLELRKRMWELKDLHDEKDKKAQIESSELYKELEALEKEYPVY